MAAKHQRRVIRDFVKDRLNDNVEALTERVFASREAPANVEAILEEGPMANVYSRKDTIKPEDYPASGFDSAVKRTLELAIEITATGSWVVDDKLDDLAEAIESLMEQDFTIPGLPSTEFRLTSTEIDSTDAFEQTLGGALMLYEVTYWRPYRVDTSDEPQMCGGDLSVVINGGPAETIPGCGDC